MTIAFDTHAAAKEFERAGFTEAQVEALIEVSRRTTSLPDISDLATKADIAALEAATKADIAALEAATKADIAALGAATKAEIAALGAATKAEISALGAATKAEISALGAATKSDIAEHRAATKVEIAELRAEISGAKVQAITVILSGTALIVALGTILSKLIH